MEEAEGAGEKKKFTIELKKEISEVIAKKEAPKHKQNDLIEAEEQDKGKVSFSDLRSFLKFSIGDSAMILYFVVCSISAACQIGITLWLKYWVL
jgi:hypothetical protein